PGSQLRTIDLPAAEVDIRNSSRIRNVVEWIRIEHDEVGTLAGGDYSQVIETEDFSRVPRGRREDLCWCDPGGNHVFQFSVHGPTDELIALLSTTVSPHADLDARCIEPRDAAGETIPRVLSSLERLG